MIEVLGTSRVSYQETCMTIIDAVVKGGPTSYRERKLLVSLGFNYHRDLRRWRRTAHGESFEEVQHVAGILKREGMSSG